MNRMRGFSLPELVVVLVIVSVLGAVAYPRYEGHLVKSRRMAVIACLLESRLQIESRHGQAPVDEGTDLAPCVQAQWPHYRIHLEQGSGWAYLLVAEAQGQQAQRDLHCQRLAINQSGSHFAGSEGEEAGRCWPY